MKQILFALLLLTACDRAERPEAPTPAEAERLDQAEEMLNALGNEDAGPDSNSQPEEPVSR